MSIIKSGDFPVLIGGDHSAAAGFWSGISTVQRHKGANGLIWIDAHMDSHTPETSPNGYVHGMPLAALMGHGYQGLTDILDSSPKLFPENICMIGVRDYEPEEKQLLERLGVRVIYMEEVNTKGMPAVFEEAIQIVTRNTVGFGVTIDLDGIDSDDAPGVSTPSGGGLKAEDLKQQFIKILENRQLLAVEISEFNPASDFENQTLNIMRFFLRALCRKLELDRM